MLLVLLSIWIVVNWVHPTKRTRCQWANWMAGEKAMRGKKGIANLNLAEFDACIWLELSALITSPIGCKESCSLVVLTYGDSKAQVMEPWSFPHCWYLQAVWATTQHPFAGCWISSWGMQSIFYANLIDGFIFQSIYLLNYPTVSKESFLINMVINRSGSQQKHILTQFVEKVNFPNFQHISCFPYQQAVN